MKTLTVATLILLQGCSSWKHKEFKQELEKTREQEAIVSVSQDLSEKFKVEEVAGPAPSVKPKAIKTLKKKVAAVPVAMVPKKTEKPKVTSPIYPSDYPKELHDVNARAKKVWDQYVPNHREGDTFYMDIHYLGMTVGKIMITNKGKRMIHGQEVWHFHSRFKSAPFYSNIYELDDTMDTYVATDKFLSIRYSLVQRESKQDVDDLQLHDREKMKTFWFYKQKKSNGDIREKQKEDFIPYYSIDPFSICFFYQGLPLKDGDVYEIPIINKAKIILLKSEVEGRETIDTEKGPKKAIRVHVVTKYKGAHLKSGDMHLWFSDDESRSLLKAKAKIKIGSVTADIVED